MSEKGITLIGYVYVVLAALLWAMSGNAAKVLFNSGLSPLHLVQLRTTIAAGVLFVWLLIFRRHLLRIARRDTAYFVLMGGILAAVHFTYLYTISLIPVAAAILIQYQSPVLIALHARVFRKKKLSPFAVIAIIGAVAGCYLMVGAYNLELFNLNRAGILAGLVSAVVFAWYAIKSEDGMRTYPAWTILTYALLIAAVFWNVVQPPFGAFRGGYDALSWGYILYIALFGTALSFGLYNLGIGSVRATHASITATLEPVFAGIIAYALLGEVLEPLQIAGAGLVIGSIILLQGQRFRQGDAR
jgi:drug/metabolite transporter (DMT)-like permease